MESLPYIFLEIGIGTLSFKKKSERKIYTSSNRNLQGEFGNLSY
jgi:hypothetical protein